MNIQKIDSNGSFECCIDLYSTWGNRRQNTLHAGQILLCTPIDFGKLMNCTLTQLEKNEVVLLRVVFK